MSIRSVNALSHYTAWNIAHVHGGALGWVGFMTFGMIYWMWPRLWQTELYSKKLATTHFWIATIGISLYVIAMWSAGITEGLMWRAMDHDGRLQYEFLDATRHINPMNWVRAFGGALYIAGLGVMAYNLYRTWQPRPANFVEIEVEVPARSEMSPVDPAPGTHPKPWHRRWEGTPLVFIVLVATSIVVASLFEIVPTFLIESNVPRIASVKPYTPLELYGRDVYIREGCYTCHSQMIRPFVDEVVRYGDYSKPGEFIYDHPFQWGSRRIGPDLQREGGKRSALWHVRHLDDPRATSPGSIMPSYPHLAADAIDFDSIDARVGAMVTLGVPYDAQTRAHADDDARAQARRIAAEIAEQGGAADLGDKEVIAVIAYLQRLGIDLTANAKPATTKVAVTGGN
jgi:cytochrome c oxidase cbb3-type subunit I/II